MRNEEEEKRISRERENWGVLIRNWSKEMKIRWLAARAAMNGSENKRPIISIIH